MKKINLLAVAILLFISCQKEDETLVSRYDTPQNFSEQTITDRSIVLKWEDVQASSYIIEYGVSGFTLGEGKKSSTNIPSITLTDLIPDTTYDYYVDPIYLDNNSNVNRFRSIRQFTTMAAPVVTEFRSNLSEMRLFRGNLSNLTPSPYAFIYDLNTKLYTDYASKQRIIAIPLGSSIVGNGDGLPDFPDNTVIAKTFYYNVDDRNEALGKNIVETRVMIKINGSWEFGDYVWNENQTDAVFDSQGSVTPISWIDTEGNQRNVDYKIPSAENCFTCHQSYNTATPIGPKLRSMNFDINGVNQLQRLINSGDLTNVSDVSSIGVLPNWEDTSFSDETRVRAYLDMNCAHCHSFGGYHTVNYYDALNLAFETRFSDSHIFEKRNSILSRIQTSIEGYSMPFLGVTSPHQEALDLIVPYLQSLE